MGGEARDPRERKGRDECVLLLGRSHQERVEAVDTLTMISHGVEISIARGGADEKDEQILVKQYPYVLHQFLSPAALLPLIFVTFFSFFYLLNLFPPPPGSQPHLHLFSSFGPVVLRDFPDTSLLPEFLS